MSITTAAARLLLFCISVELACSNCTRPDSGTTLCSCAGVKSLHCSGITDEDVLRETYALFESSRFGELRISDSSLAFVPTDAAVLEDAKTVQVSRSSLDFLFADVQPSSLDTLVLEEVDFVHGMMWESLEDVPNLRNLIVRDVELPAIDAEFSRSVSRKLRTMVLRNTSTSYVEEHAFKHHVHLSDLRIESAELTEVQRSMLPRPAELLVVLSFAENKIDHLPKDFFVQMPQLKIVDFSYNHLKQIPWSLSSVYKNIQALFLEGNPVVCDCTLQWMVWGKSTSSQHVRDRHVEGVCAHPDRLIGVELVELAAADFRHCRARRFNKLAKNVIAMRVRKMNHLIKIWSAENSAI